MKTYIAAAAALAMAACTNGQAEVNVLETNVASFAAPSPEQVALAQAVSQAGLTMSTDGHVTFDIHNDLKSLGDLGSISADVQENTLSGAELGALQHIHLEIAPADGSLPSIVVSDVDIASGSTTVPLPLLVSSDTLLKYLGEGKIDLHFWVTGTLPSTSFQLTHTIAARLAVATSGPIKL